MPPLVNKPTLPPFKEVGIFYLGEDMSSKTTVVTLNTDELFTEANRTKLEKALNLSDIKILKIVVKVPVQYVRREKLPVVNDSIMFISIGTTVDLSALGEIIADQTDDQTTVDGMVSKGIELLYNKQCSMLQHFFVIH